MCYFTKHVSLPIYKNYIFVQTRVCGNLYSSLNTGAAITREENNSSVPGQLRLRSCIRASPQSFAWITLNLDLVHSEFPETSAGGSADVLDVEEERGVWRDDAGGGLPPSAPGPLLAVGQRRRQLQRPLTP